MYNPVNIEREAHSLVESQCQKRHLLSLDDQIGTEGGQKVQKISKFWGEADSYSAPLPSGWGRGRSIQNSSNQRLIVLISALSLPRFPVSHCLCGCALWRYWSIRPTTWILAPIGTLCERYARSIGMRAVRHAIKGKKHALCLLSPLYSVHASVYGGLRGCGCAVFFFLLGFMYAFTVIQSLWCLQAV